jgi:hypothetical protein
LQRLIDADKLHSAAVIARERTRFEPVGLIDGLQLNARAAAIAFEMAGANIVIAMPTVRHLKPQLGIGALLATMETKEQIAKTQTQIRITGVTGSEYLSFFDSLQR